jgi:hypothetical protein
MKQPGVAVAVAVCLAYAAPAWCADAPAQLTDAPPYIDSISFTDDALYLGTPGVVPADASQPSPPPMQVMGKTAEIYYRWDRKGGPLIRVAAVPAQAQGMPVSSVTLEGMTAPGGFNLSATYLVTSDADVYQLPTFDCPRTAPGVRLLTVDCKPVAVPVSPDQSVTAVEDFGDYLLLGVRLAADPAVGPGVMVLSRPDYKQVRSIGQNDGLAENLVRLIRRDPKTGGLWVETPRSLAELSSKFEVLHLWYLHLGLDADGVPSLVLSENPEYDDPFASLALKLHVSDYAGYGHAVAAIPAASRPQLFTSVFPQGRAAYARIPVAFDSLYPFFAADIALNSDPRQSQFASQSLCKFDDPRARQLADKLIQTTKGMRGHNLWLDLKDCADPALVEAYRPPTPPASGSYVVDAKGNYIPTGSAHGMALMRATSPKPGYAIMIASFTPPFFYWDGQRPLHLADQTENYGGGTSGPSLTRYYISPVLPVDPASAQVIAERMVPPLVVGQIDAHGMDVKPPADLPRGLYYVAVCANADHKQPQAYEDDRCRVPNLPLQLAPP